MMESNGKKYDQGKPNMSLVLDGFPNALLAVGEVATFGAAKYEAHSWRTVPSGIERYSSAAARHRLARGAGEINDSESQLMHAAHEAWNVLAVLELLIDRHRGGKNE